MKFTNKLYVSIPENWTRIFIDAYDQGRILIKPEVDGFKDRLHFHTHHSPIMYLNLETKVG